MTPCFNVNISAIRTAWTDTANTYIYAYDAQNRLLFSKRLTDYAAHNSELFGYDDMGNITSLKWFSGNRMIDDLDLDYGNIGAYWEETFQLYDETWEYVPASTAYSYGLHFLSTYQVQSLTEILVFHLHCVLYWGYPLLSIIKVSNYEKFYVNS